MARYDCARCGAVYHIVGDAEPHICKDIYQRLKRRERQVAAVIDILEDAMDGYGDPRHVAENIVATLANLDVTND